MDFDIEFIHRKNNIVEYIIHSTCLNCRNEHQYPKSHIFTYLDNPPFRDLYIDLTSDKKLLICKVCENGSDYAPLVWRYSEYDGLSLNDGKFLFLEKRIEALENKINTFEK